MSTLETLDENVEIKTKLGWTLLVSIILALSYLLLTGLIAIIVKYLLAVSLAIMLLDLQTLCHELAHRHMLNREGIKSKIYLKKALGGRNIELTRADDLKYNKLSFRRKRSILLAGPVTDFIFIVALTILIQGMSKSFLRSVLFLTFVARTIGFLAGFFVNGSDMNLVLFRK